MLALVADRVQELTVSREQTGTVGFGLVTLLAQTELDGEPVDGRELLDLLVAGAERSQTDLLRELGKVWIGQQGYVTEELVDRVTILRMKKKGICFFNFPCTSLRPL